MASELEGRRVAVLVANEGVERVELTEPVRALREAGATVEIVAPEAGEVQLFDHLDRAGTVPVDHVVAKARPEDFDALVLPGGVANPDHLRTLPEAVGFAGSFVRDDKPVGVICHGPWTLLEAGVLEGRTITSWPSLHTDLANAGATWVDEQVHRDGRLISSRRPDDLPAFCRAVVETVAQVPAHAGSHHR